MFGIIWTVVVIWICYRIYKQRMGNPSENGQIGQVRYHRMPGETFQGQKPIQEKPPAQPARAKQIPQVKGQKKQSAEIQAKNKSEQESTLAYLEEKARQDAIEHEMEKREEARRLYESSGGLRPAQRLYEGDIAPNGCRCISCGYCGAQNLIPAAARERFSCYFCREPLDT